MHFGNLIGKLLSRWKLFQRLRVGIGLRVCGLGDRGFNYRTKVFVRSLHQQCGDLNRDREAWGELFADVESCWP